MGRSLIIGAAALALLGGYAAADVLDVAPGVLTRDQPTPLPTATATGPSPTLRPLPTPTGKPTVLAGLPVDAPEPTPTALAKHLADALGDARLGPSVGVSIRDAATGTQLYAASDDQPRVAASTQKILTAAAVGTVLDAAATMTTAVVARPATRELVLVAGGDTLLAESAGKPDEVAGRAGLADLADQVSAGLSAHPAATSWTLRLDLTYAAGPRYPSRWSRADVAAGYTQGVAMLGFAADRPVPGKASPADPERTVLNRFAAQLEDRGVDVEVADSATLRATAAPADATRVGAVESAAYGEVLSLALDESDNALTENLARQASVAAGGEATFEAATAFVESTLRANGLDLSGTHLTDTSGLAGGQTTTVRLLSAVVAKGLDGTFPQLAAALAGLPVAGLDGTLHDRFRTGPAAAAAGLARAKTGTLTGSSGLVGYTVDADDRPLTFVVIADRVPAGTGTLGARAALDEFVAALTACGCS